MLPVLGPFSKNKTNWYILVCWSISITLLALSEPKKDLVTGLIRQVLYSPFQQAGEKVRGLYQVHLENQKLRQQIAGMTVENGILEEQRLENHRLRQLLELRSILDFEVIPAEVVTRDPIFRLHSVHINAGSQSGVLRDLPVIDRRGLVGKVTEAFDKTSTVQLLFDPGFKLSCLVQRSRVTGIVSWKTGQLLKLDYVPSNADLQEGDEIVTSGLSGIYPAGLKIGRVIKVGQDRESLFKTVEVSPYADIYNLEELFVIKTYPE
ncbi:MAG: rod shape-determining protein MreC [candidate division Zixibacteria bacterium RBG_16_48_11]|nr:MAG: rod shape-determining protein MreC [candidate division Zixibacteria bacterium RBG_16_48_11]